MEGEKKKKRGTARLHLLCAWVTVKLFYLAYVTLLEAADLTPFSKNVRGIKVWLSEPAPMFCKSADQTWQPCKITSDSGSAARERWRSIHVPSRFYQTYFHYHRQLALCEGPFSYHPLFPLRVAFNHASRALSLKGNFAYFTHLSVFTGLGEYVLERKKKVV